MAAVLLAGIPTAAWSQNANCRNTGSFDSWLAGFRQAAAAGGISRPTISAALDGMTLDPGIIGRDRKQSFFAQSFTAFSGYFNLVDDEGLAVTFKKVKLAGVDTVTLKDVNGKITAEIE